MGKGAESSAPLRKEGPKSICSCHGAYGLAVFCCVICFCESFISRVFREKTHSGGSWSCYGWSDMSKVRKAGMTESKKNPYPTGRGGIRAGGWGGRASRQLPGLPEAADIGSSAVCRYVVPVYFGDVPESGTVCAVLKRFRGRPRQRGGLLFFL